MKLTQTKSSILESKPVEEGFLVGKYEDPLMYAAVPLMGSDTQLSIIHQGKSIKICRNRLSAINFIKKHQKQNKKKK
tara:strand:+ start:795 stop:1025 length:231 start_codon:yes stop_codon:yes gene_type:complete